MEIDNHKESTIELLGAAGFFVSAGCALQALVLIKFGWVLVVTLLVYVLLFSSYLLFYKMNPWSLLLLWISGGLLFLLQVLLLMAGAILWISVVFTVFTLIVIVMIYMQDLHTYMKEVELDQKASVW